MQTERGKIAYSLSTDYEKLWDRIKNGERVPGYLRYNERLWDIVEIKMLGNRPMMGTRGIGYEDYSCNKENFIENCKIYEVQFIVSEKSDE